MRRNKAQSLLQQGFKISREDRHDRNLYRMLGRPEFRLGKRCHQVQNWELDMICNQRKVKLERLHEERTDRA